MAKANPAPLDGLNVEHVASREPDGMWACCLCDGWKNRACDDPDFKYDGFQIIGHLSFEHQIITGHLLKERRK